MDNKLHLNPDNQFNGMNRNDFKQMLISMGFYVEDCEENGYIEFKEISKEKNMLDKIKHIQEILPNGYEFYLRTNKSCYSLCKDGKWFVHLTKDAKDDIINHEITLYKKYGDDIDEMLTEVIKMLNDINLNNTNKE